VVKSKPSRSSNLITRRDFFGALHWQIFTLSILVRCCTCIEFLILLGNYRDDDFFVVRKLYRPDFKRPMDKVFFVTQKSVKAPGRLLRTQLLSGHSRQTLHRFIFWSE
jgi:hypothetical protein